MRPTCPFIATWKELCLMLLTGISGLKPGMLTTFGFHVPLRGEEFVYPLMLDNGKLIYGSSGPIGFFQMLSSSLHWFNRSHQMVTPQTQDSREFV